MPRPASLFSLPQVLIPRAPDKLHTCSSPSEFASWGTRPVAMPCLLPGTEVGQHKCELSPSRFWPASWVTSHPTCLYMFRILCLAQTHLLLGAVPDGPLSQGWSMTASWMFNICHPPLLALWLRCGEEQEQNGCSVNKQVLPVRQGILLLLEAGSTLLVPIPDQRMCMASRLQAPAHVFYDAPENPFTWAAQSSHFVRDHAMKVPNARSSSLVGGPLLQRILKKSTG